MAWIALVVAGLLEAGWALLLKESHGFTRLWPSVGFGVLLALSMGGLAFALRTLPVGTAYAVWVGIGAVTTAVLAMVFLDEPATIAKVASILLIIAGVVGLNLAGGGH
ncbi:MAG: multidrug efflux SMR transporter [Brevundimonas sp.]